jgi:hypothetical protein
MRFLTPAFLGLAALAVPILILYMLRLRRREVPVSSTMLWQRLMQDREANAPWQRLRRNLLLLLQLLILAALVIALAQPYLPVPSVAAGSVALLIDTSASMSAVDMPGGASRLEAARDRARAIAGELGAEDVMTVIAVGPTPLVLSPPISDRAALREAIARAQPSSAPADWEAALALASASIAGREDASIVIISDGGLPDDLPALSADVRFVGVGRQPHNLAISALAIRPLDDHPQLFAAVTNYGPQDADTILSIEVDGALTTAERLTVPAGETTSLTLTDLPATARHIRAVLTPPVAGAIPDYLAVDDVAYTVYAPPGGGRVLLVSEGNLFLSQLLGSLIGIEAFQAAPGETPQEPFDLVVFDRYVPETLPPTNLLIVAPPRATNLFTIGDMFSDTRFLRQSDDQILSFVEFRTIAVREARQVQATGWARTLVEAEGGPLLIAGSQDGRRIAILTFDLHASDLPLQIAFPILMANLLEWYAPASPVEAAQGMTPGDPVVIRPQATTTDYRVTMPDGSRLTFAADAELLSFARTEQPGIYRVELLSGQQVTGEGSFAVNLFARGESSIAPRETITVGATTVDDTRPADEYGQRGLWPWLALAALVVLAVEWWVYHRGTAITRRERDTRERQPRRRLLYFGRRQ